MTVTIFLTTLVAILVAAKIFGELAERIGQPAVLGELVAGVIVGGSVLGLVDPHVEVVHLLAEVGVIILLLEIGLETDLKRLFSVGPAAAVVAFVGVALPFLMGYGTGMLFGLGTLPSVVAGAALTATSVGITARVLSDLGRLRDPEGQIVLGAAVIDDVLGLIILAVVADLTAGEWAGIAGVARTTAIAFGFLGGTLLLGRFIVPPLFQLIARHGKEPTIAAMGLVFAFLLAVLADAAGSAAIIGAFAAGLLLRSTEQAHAIEKGVLGVGHFFVPIFFVAVGAAVDLAVFGNRDVLLLGGALTLVAIVGKVAAGYAPFWFRGRKSVIGVGMVPRGEVGLIFAQTGLTTGVLDAGQFGALMLMVIVTTFVAPPTLKALLKPVRQVGEPELSGVADLTTEV
jgi:Kef-type K+ transport system membrane component KefB